MPIDASVMCNCFRDGKTKPPPVPLAQLEFDSEGYINTKPGYESIESANNLYYWEQTCCEHKGMKAAFAGIANKSGYRYFQTALAQLGWENFPTLESELYDESRATTPTRLSAIALTELDWFSQLEQVGTQTVLIDSQTRDVVKSHLTGFGGLFLRRFPSGPNTGLSDSELYVETSNSKTILFHSESFTQSKPKKKWFANEIISVVWKDLKSGKRFKSSDPLAIHKHDDQGNQSIDYYPQRMHIETDWKVFSKEFDYIVKPLKTIFQASVDTGNPVRWSY